MSGDAVSPGFVLFRIGRQTFATPLDAVREIVRLRALEPLPGARPPLAGVIGLRGRPLPVLDIRDAVSTAMTGDVLVVELDGDVVGVAVDGVVAALDAGELTDGSTPPRRLPDYVVEVRRREDTTLLVVDLHRLLDVVATGWNAAIDSAALVG